jgi:hypothetical protein
MRLCMVSGARNAWLPLASTCIGKAKRFAIADGGVADHLVETAKFVDAAALCCTGGGGKVAFHDCFGLWQSFTSDHP